MARYRINDAPSGGWIDTLTGVSFTDKNQDSPYYKEFVEWSKTNAPDPPEIRTLDTSLDFGAQPDEDRTQIQQLIMQFNNYMQNDTPNTTQRKQWENGISRAMKFVLRRVV